MSPNELPVMSSDSRLHPSTTNRPVLLVRVEKMKHIKRVVLEPFHVASLAVHRADLRPVLRFPNHQRLSRRRILDVEHGRTYEEDRVVIGRDKIVHHHRQSRINRPRLDELAVAACAIPRRVRRERLVTEEQQVAIYRIELGMRRDGASSLPPKSNSPTVSSVNGLSSCGDAGFEQREQAIGVSNDVGVGGVLERRHIRAAARAHAQLSCRKAPAPPSSRP